MIHSPPNVEMSQREALRENAFENGICWLTGARRSHLSSCLKPKQGDCQSGIPTSWRNWPKPSDKRDPFSSTAASPSLSLSPFFFCSRMHSFAFALHTNNWRVGIIQKARVRHPICSFLTAIYNIRL